MHKLLRESGYLVISADTWLPQTIIRSIINQSWDTSSLLLAAADHRAVMKAGH